jgi:hypothetical protein
MLDNPQIELRRGSIGIDSSANVAHISIYIV